MARSRYSSKYVPTGKKPFANRDSRSGARHDKLLLGVLALAAVLRLYKLGTYPFWNDEVHNLIKTENIVDVLLRGEYVSNHPPLFAATAAGWRFLAFGDLEWFMRLLPAAIGVGVVGVTYWAGRTLFNARTGLIAALFVAVSPFFVTHSQDLKEYILLPLTGTFAVVALYRAVDTNAVCWWVAYGLGAALACYSEAFAGPLLVAVNVWYMLQVRGRWHTLPGWIASNVAAVALFVPYLPILLRRADKMLVESNVWWVPAPTLLSVVYYVKTIAFGYAALDPAYKIVTVVFVAVFIVGLVFAFRTSPRIASFALCWFVAPIAIVYGLSLLMESIFLYRAMLAYAIPFYLFIGFACAQIKWRGASAAATGVLACLVLPGLAQHYARVLHPEQFPHRPGIHPPQDYPGVVAHIREHWQDGDVVLTAAMNAWLTMRWYGLRDRPVYFGAVGQEFIDDIVAGNPRTSEDPEWDMLYPRDIGSVVDGSRRVWFVFAEWERSYLQGNATQIWRWLDARSDEVDRLEFMNVDLRLYDTDREKRTTRRVRDDGVTAVLERAGEEEPYRLVTPDRGLIAGTPTQRKGPLHLSLGGDAWEKRHSVAQGDDTRLVTFILANTGRSATTCDVMAVACDLLVETAALRNAETNVVDWRTMGQHRPGNAGMDYELPVAAVRLSEYMPAVLTGKTSLAPGTYDTAVFMLGQPGDGAHQRADVAVLLAGQPLLPLAGNVPFAWTWLIGAEIESDGTAQALTVTATPLRSNTESFADVAYVAFLRKRKPVRAGFRATSLFSRTWPGRVTLNPGESRSWTLEVDEDIGRVDVWVWDRGPDGKVYQVFERGVRAR